MPDYPRHSTRKYSNIQAQADQLCVLWGILFMARKTSIGLYMHMGSTTSLSRV